MFVNRLCEGAATAEPLHRHTSPYIRGIVGFGGISCKKLKIEATWKSTKMRLVRHWDASKRLSISVLIQRCSIKLVVFGNLIIFSILSATSPAVKHQGGWDAGCPDDTAEFFTLLQLGGEAEERGDHAGLESSYVLHAVLNRAPHTSRPPRAGALCVSD